MGKLLKYFNSLFQYPLTISLINNMNFIIFNLLLSSTFIFQFCMLSKSSHNQSLKQWQWDSEWVGDSKPENKQMSLKVWTLSLKNQIMTWMLWSGFVVILKINIYELHEYTRYSNSYYKNGFMWTLLLWFITTTDIMVFEENHSVIFHDIPVH